MACILPPDTDFAREPRWDVSFTEAVAQQRELAPLARPEPAFLADRPSRRR
jgi:hypothetical protein